MNEKIDHSDPLCKGNGKKRRTNRPEDVYVSYIAQCIALAGDWRAGVLLYCIWTREPKFKRDDQLWHIETRAQWMRITGLSEWQYDEALRVLKKQKLIVATVDKVGKHDRYQQTFIRLPDGFHLEEKSAGVSPPGFPGGETGSPPGFPGGDQGDHLLVLPEILENTRDTGSNTSDREPGEAPTSSSLQVVSSFLQQKEASGRGNGVSLLPTITLREEALPMPHGVLAAAAELHAKLHARIGAGSPEDHAAYNDLMVMVARLDFDQGWRLGHLLQGTDCGRLAGKDRGLAGMLTRAWDGYPAGLVAFSLVVGWDEFVAVAQGDVRVSEGKAFKLTRKPSVDAVQEYTRLTIPHYLSWAERRNGAVEEARRAELKRRQEIEAKRQQEERDAGCMEEAAGLFDRAVTMGVVLRGGRYGDEPIPTFDDLRKRWGHYGGEWLRDYLREKIDAHEKQRRHEEWLQDLERKRREAAREAA